MLSVRYGTQLRSRWGWISDLGAVHIARAAGVGVLSGSREPVEGLGVEFCGYGDGPAVSDHWC